MRLRADYEKQFKKAMKRGLLKELIKIRYFLDYIFPSKKYHCGILADMKSHSAARTHEWIGLSQTNAQHGAPKTPYLTSVCEEEKRSVALF